MYTPQPAPSSRPLSYAPTPYNYIPSLPSTQIPLDEEVKLASTSTERDLIDSLAELYSIIRTIDGLERAYQKNSLRESEYNEMCRTMIKQYKSILSDQNVSREFGDLEEFMRKWDIEAPRAFETLKTGLMPTEIHAATPLPPGVQSIQAASSNQPSGTLILTATENFITFLDALRLNMLSKSSLHPLLSDVIQSVNKVTDQDFENRGKIIQWLIKLNQMRAGEELKDEEAEECSFDIESAYQGFKGVIAG